MAPSPSKPRSAVKRTLPEKPAAPAARPALRHAAPPSAAEKSARRSRRFQLIFIIAGVGAVALAVTLFVLTRDRAQAVETFPAPSRPAVAASFEGGVAAPGRVEAVSGLRNLSFDLAGKIRKVYVEQGQNVAAGQLIAELENEPATARRDAARAELAQAQARYAITDRELLTSVVKAEQDVARLKAELALLVAGPRAEEIAAARAETAAANAEAQQAADDEHRYFDPTGKYESWARQLYDQAHRRAEATAAKRDAAAAHQRELEAGTRAEELDQARALLAAAGAELERLHATRQLQLDTAQAQIVRAQANLDNLEAELKRTRLTAPIAGVVVWKFLHGGEVIDAIQQQPVVAVADISHLRVRASIDEADYARIAAGQSVRITADAFGTQAFHGRVALVGAAAGEKPFTTGDPKEKQDIRVIETLIDLDSVTPLKLGLRVTVFINTK